MRFFDGIARDAAGDPLASPELVVQPFFRTADGGRENVLVRGVEAVALQVHDDVAIVEGRMFQPVERRGDRRERRRGPLRRRAARRHARVRPRALEGGRPLRERRLVVRERGLGGRARTRRRRQAHDPVLGPARARRRRRGPGRARAPHRRRPALRARGDARARVLREAGRVGERALLHRDRARGAGRDRRRLRRDQHALRRGAVAPRRDRHPARARLLAHRRS